jgi:hypothetical protein
MTIPKVGLLSEPAARWRRVFCLDAALPAVRDPDMGAFESAALGSSEAESPTPDDRISQALEAMRRIVRDRFGGDAQLLKRIGEISLSAQQAIDILRDTSTVPTATGREFEALEAVVVFDGSRPSFLVKNDRIDFATSYNTGNWKTDLAPLETALVEYASCVCRVELKGNHLGTAFLVTPTLAITNRHVAQALANLKGAKPILKSGCGVDFGREASPGRSTFDPRTVEEIAFTGASEISGAIDHNKLDLAVLRLSPSKLEGAAKNRHLAIGAVTAFELFDSNGCVVAIGYPADPKLYVPNQIWSEYGGIIRLLLEGEGGLKRLAPGQPLESARDGLADWTATHDATTINGNSGSPLFKFPIAEGPVVAGLHYGGRSGGDAVNWAHLLHYAADKQGYGHVGTFRDYCLKAGVELS